MGCMLQCPAICLSQRLMYSFQACRRILEEYVDQFRDDIGFLGLLHGP
jgi:hypothetical protein